MGLDFMAKKIEFDTRREKSAKATNGVD